LIDKWLYNHQDQDQDQDHCTCTQTWKHDCKNCKANGILTF
jgi:hypothetical protein